MVPDGICIILAFFRNLYFKRGKKSVLYIRDAILDKCSVSHKNIRAVYYSTYNVIQLRLDVGYGIWNRPRFTQCIVSVLALL